MFGILFLWYCFYRKKMSFSFQTVSILPCTHLVRISLNGFKTYWIYVIRFSLTVPAFSMCNRYIQTSNVTQQAQERVKSRRATLVHCSLRLQTHLEVCLMLSVALSITTILEFIKLLNAQVRYIVSHIRLSTAYENCALGKL